MTPLLLVGVAVAGAAVGLGLVRLLHPALARYALSQPTARSSHKAPTPQGGGIAVIGGALAAAIWGFSVWGGGWETRLAVLAAATLAIAALGLVDDLRPLSPALRLPMQLACVAAIVCSQPARLLPDAIPLAAEWTILILAGTWWVNLTNFMDGIDWMTVAALGPVTAALCVFGLAGVIAPAPAIVAAALLGGLLGFAPVNRPVARLFLGDVGSLPIGLVSGWLLLELAASGAIAAAILLPLYYLADATITLARRVAGGEAVWQAHRSHFYQRALANGLSVLAVDGRVLALNLTLAALAGSTIVWRSLPLQCAALTTGAGLVGWTLLSLARPRARG